MHFLGVALGRTFQSPGRRFLPDHSNFPNRLAATPDAPSRIPQAAAPGAEHVLIAVKDSAEAPALVAAGRRLAERIGAGWSILHVETIEASRAPERARQDLADMLLAAQALGASATCIAADDVAGAIARHARLENATHLVAGAPRTGPRIMPWRSSLLARIVKQLDGVCVQVAARTAPAPAASRAAMMAPPGAWPYCASVLLVIAASAIAFGLNRYLPAAGVSVVFLTAVLIAATEFGPVPALFASLLSMLSFDFFFLTPVYSLAIGSAEEMTAFFTFGLAALIASRFAIRVRAQAYAAQRRAAEASDLHRLTRGLAGAATLSQVAEAIAAGVFAATDLPAAVLLAGNATRPGLCRVPVDAPFSARDFAAALACLEPGSPAPGQTTPASATSIDGWRFSALRTGGRTVGVVGVRAAGTLTLTKEHRLAAIAGQAAVAIDRITLAAELEQERQRDATDRLHAALLASISHDLRAPLTAIMGSATTLAECGTTLPAPVRAELIDTVCEEAQRLDRFMSNLLDMARLEGAAFRARLIPTDLADVADAALRRAAPVLGGRAVDLRIAADLPLVPLDPALLEQVLFNLIDNACKHGGAGAGLVLSLGHAAGRVEISLADEGPGFRPDQLKRVFDKFFHGGGGRGAGLGLAICRGFVEAMHGSITARNRVDRPGAVVELCFPVPAAAPIEAGGVCHAD